MRTYDFDEDENLILLPETEYVVLGQEEQRELVRLLVMGRCPFCYNLIPEEDRVCNACLDEIAEYWRREHDWGAFSPMFR